MQESKWSNNKVPRHLETGGASLRLRTEKKGGGARFWGWRGREENGREQGSVEWDAVEALGTRIDGDDESLVWVMRLVVVLEVVSAACERSGGI